MHERDLAEELANHGLIPVLDPPPPPPQAFPLFGTVTSERFVKESPSIEAYKLDILKIIEDNSVKDLTKSIDQDLLDWVLKTMS